MQREATIQATPFLETERLILKPLTLADAPAMYDTLKPREVHGIISVFTSPMTLEQAEDWCNFSKDFTTKGKGYLTGIFNKTAPDTPLMGYAGIACAKEYGKHPDRNIWEIGYWLDKQQQGKGFAKEAASALIEFGRDRLLLKGLFATTATYNIASGNVLTGNGFKLTHSFPMKTSNGTIRDSNYYELNFDR